MECNYLNTLDNPTQKRSTGLTTNGSAGTLMWGYQIRQIGAHNQVSMPPAFAAALGSPFILTRSAGGCLMALSQQRWKRLVKNHDNPDFLVFYGGSAVQCWFHQSATYHKPQFAAFVLPWQLKDYAGLRIKTEAAIVGVGRAVIIVRPEAWNKTIAEFEQRILGLCSSLGRVRDLALDDLLPNGSLLRQRAPTAIDDGRSPRKGDPIVR